MNWYTAKIIFHIVREGEHCNQFDEQLRLLKATDEQQAFEKAKAIGLQEEETFKDENQNSIKWVFINVSELCKLETISDGMQINSGTEKQDDAQEYISFIHRKAEAIQQKFSQLSLTTFP